MVGGVCVSIAIHRLISDDSERVLSAPSPFLPHFSEEKSKTLSQALV